jgi:uncharacterized protein YjlB
MRDVVAHLLAPDGPIPNHPRWPLLIYPNAVAISGPDPAAAFEEMFTRNRWPAAWRNGVFPFHHFHSNGHEALGIYEGEVTVQFGGDSGEADCGAVSRFAAIFFHARDSGNISTSRLE